MELIAHRAGTDRYPELTLDAARYSLQAGAAYVELDIRFTREDIPVISHDDNAQRLFGSPCRIDELTLDEFLSLHYAADAHYSTLTLSQVLESGVAPILFHVKVGGERLLPLLDCIHSHDYAEKCVLGLMTPADVHFVKAQNPAQTVLAFGSEKETVFAQAKSGADIVRLWENWVTPKDIAALHAMGKRVWVMAGTPRDGSVGFTADEHLAAWHAMGADGVLINESDHARALLG